MKITELDTVMGHWYPGARHFQCGDGYLAVHADEHLGDGSVEHTTTRHGIPAVRKGKYTIVKTPTVILWCDKNGIAESMTPAWSFPPDTSVEEALQQAGFELEG